MTTAIKRSKKPSLTREAKLIVSFAIVAFLFLFPQPNFNIRYIEKQARIYTKVPITSSSSCIDTNNAPPGDEEGHLSKTDWSSCKNEAYYPTADETNPQDKRLLNKPLNDVTIVITGATSGIGLGLTKLLYALGGTIVAIGRSSTKLQDLQNELQSIDLKSNDNDENDFIDVKVTTSDSTTDTTNDTSKMHHDSHKPSHDSPRFIPILADFNDLNSISKAAEVISQKMNKIDFLINNAGIASNTDGISTKQGYDLVFGVNYLSHFLLTGKLIPLLEKSTMPNSSKIIQVTSTLHYGSNGQELVPTRQVHLSSPSSSTVSTGLNRLPAASVPHTTKDHDTTSYGSSKLAQIYHTRSLNREFMKAGLSDKIKVLNVCPGWVSTNMTNNQQLSSKLYQLLFHRFAFDANEFGLASILHAMFYLNNNVENPLTVMSSLPTHYYSDYVTNHLLMGRVTSFLLHPFIYATDKIGIRQYFVTGFACISLSWMKTVPNLSFVISSKESYDVAKQNALYNWSMQAISSWL